MRAEAAPGVVIASLADMVAMADRSRDIQLKIALERDIRPILIEDGRLEFSLVDGASPELAQILTRRLQEWTGRRWLVAISATGGAPSLNERAGAAREKSLQGVRAEPLVRSIFERFPGAEIVSVRAPEETPAPAAPEAGDDVGYADAIDPETEA